MCKICQAGGTGTCQKHEAQIQQEVEKLLTRMSMRVLAVRKAIEGTEVLKRG
jgi:hypothetical protein